MNPAAIDERIDRIIELRTTMREIEQELRELLGDTDPNDSQSPTGKRRVVRYEKSMEEYVLLALAEGVSLNRDDIYKQIRIVAGATLLRNTVNNAISSLRRKGTIEKLDGDVWRIVQTGQAALTDIIQIPPPSFIPPNNV